MVLSKNELTAICQQGMRLMQEASAYSQVDIVQKLEYLGQRTSKTSFNNILNDKRTSPKTLMITATGIQTLIQKELNMGWVNGRFVKMPNDKFQPEIIPSVKEEVSYKGYVLHVNGRLTTGQKVAFFTEAQQEVIEFGVSLNRFTHNLCFGGHDELKAPIASLLERGVNFKCYLLNPDCNEARLYFDDRKITHPDEAHYAQKIEDNLKKLAVVQAEFSQANYPGSFQVFTYRHVPYNYFMVVDGSTEHCKMMVSHYLYGLDRKLAPVLEFSKQHSAILCRRYWDSFQALMKNATKK